MSFVRIVNGILSVKIFNQTGVTDTVACICHYNNIKTSITNVWIEYKVRG